MPSIRGSEKVGREVFSRVNCRMIEKRVFPGRACIEKGNGGVVWIVTGDQSGPDKM